MQLTTMVKGRCVASTFWWENLQKLAKEELVDSFDFNSLQNINFCEPCLEGKHHRRKFPDGCRNRRSDEPLGLIHSDVCGKMNAKPLSGVEYFLTFTDDKTRYVWIEVFVDCVSFLVVASD